MPDTLPYFYYKGINCLDEQLYIQEKNTYAGAARDVSFISVPGRDGDLIVDKKRYKNIDINYKVAALDGIHDIPEIAHRVKSWLSSELGYNELIDSYNPDYYRLAAYVDAYDLKQELKWYGTSTIKFKCKPFRYRLDGKAPVILSAAGLMRNPEAFSSKPYIKITGSGNITLTVNTKPYEFKNIDGYIEIDSEMMNAYKGATSQNSKMVTHEFPELSAGDNSVSWTGTVTSVEIIPRWRCL